MGMGAGTDSSGAGVCACLGQILSAEAELELAATSAGSHSAHAKCSVPSYRVSRGYLTNINMSGTVVDTTVITNVYNTTIIH